MSNGTIEGTVHFIEETKSYGQKGFRKRLVVIEQNNGRFTNYIPIEFVQDSCDDADRLNPGDKVQVSYRLNGRKWQRDPQSEVKSFLSAEATGFMIQGRSSSSEPAAPSEDVPYGETFSSDEDPPF